MDLEFQKEEHGGKGVILLSGGDVREIEELRAALVSLFTEGENVGLHSLAFVHAIDSCRLVAVSVGRGGGLERKHGEFRWSLTPSEWEDVVDLLEPFVTSPGPVGETRFQFLNPKGGAGVVYSTTREW